MPEIIPFFIISPSPSPSKEIHHLIKCYIKITNAPKLPLFYRCDIPTRQIEILGL